MHPIINFYIRSRNVRARVDDAAQVHVCVSDWGRIMYRLAGLTAPDDEPERAQQLLRDLVAGMNPTNGTRRNEQPR